MKRIYQLLIVFGAMIVLILLTGCGTPTTTGTNPPLKATNSPTHTASTAPVTLHIGATTYRSNDTLIMTLSNQSNETIYFPDHLTNCSVILLQRLPVQPLASDGGPTAISPCRSEIVTRMHSLAAGQSLVVKLTAPPNGWLAGIYRATLSYSTVIKQPTSISSAAFPVGSFVPQP